MKYWKKLSKGAKITWLIMVPTVITAIYIMVHGLGLQDSLDFGAGAYFYVDMPNFERWTVPDFYQSPVSMWVLIVLFLIWGVLMWKLWNWLDRKMSEDSHEV